jgi:ABC-type branched-subunit amino acid transport system substrate-binding protein
MITRPNYKVSAFAILAIWAFLGVHIAQGSGKHLPEAVDIALAIHTTDPIAAIDSLQEAWSTVSSDSDKTSIALYLGEFYRLKNECDQANQWFGTVQEISPKGPPFFAAELGALLCPTIPSQEGPDLSRLKTIREKFGLSTQNAHRFMWISLGSEGKISRDARRRSLAYALEDDRVYEMVNGVFSGTSSEEYQPTAPVLSPIEQAEIALENGELERGKQLAQQLFDQAEQGSIEARAADYMVQRSENYVPVDPHHIAVILPLKGKYAAAGRHVREALEAGYQQVPGLATLYFIDSGSTPETAQAALEKAVLQQGAIAILGPLLTIETTAVIETAEALRVPLISLSQALDNPQDYEWILQGVITPKEEIRALVHYGMNTEGLSSFAIFSPDTAYGNHASDIFQSVVTELGGEVTVIEQYDAHATDLIEFAQLLGRKDYEARHKELRNLRKKAEERGRNSDRVVLPPTLDFDALFIPDSASRIPLACAALAYEEFPMGDFLPTKESPQIPLLGLSSWNRTSLVSNGGPYVRGSIFTDVFLPPASLPPRPKVEDPEVLPDESGENAEVQSPPTEALDPVVQFVLDFQENQERSPSTREAIAFDIGRLLSTASLNEVQSRAGFLKALMTASLPASVTGGTHFNPDSHRMQAHIQMLTINDKEILVHTPTPLPIDE